MQATGPGCTGDAAEQRRAQAFPVVMFTNSFLMGGMEEHITQLSRGLVQRGFTVAVICSPVQAIHSLRAALLAAGAAVYALPERGHGFAAVRARLRMLVRTLRAYPGCVLHLHLTGYEGGDLPAMAGRLAGARAVLRTMHLPPVADPGMRHRLMLRLRDALLDEIICASEQNRRAHMELLGRQASKCRLIHHGVNVDRFKPRQPSEVLRAELGLAKAGAVIGTISRLGERRKGIADFLEMAATASSQQSELGFLIVGDGDLRPELETQARELRIANRVVFTGERSDIPEMLALMDVFVMPSHYEAGPYTLLEAMAAGRPVVSTSTGLAPEVIQNGHSGFLVPTGDVPALSRAVLALLCDDDLARRLGARGREQVERHHSLSAMVNATIDAYHGIS